MIDIRTYLGREPTEVERDLLAEIERLRLQLQAHTHDVQNFITVEPNETSRVIRVRRHVLMGGDDPSILHNWLVSLSEKPEGYSEVWTGPLQSLINTYELVIMELDQNKYEYQSQVPGEEDGFVSIQSRTVLFSPNLV